MIRIDGATLNVYVAHLTAWAQLNAASRGKQEPEFELLRQLGIAFVELRMREETGRRRDVVRMRSARDIEIARLRVHCNGH